MRKIFSRIFRVVKVAFQARLELTTFRLGVGKFNISGVITKSCHAKKHRKIKGSEQFGYTGISCKDTPYYLKKLELLAWLLALAAGEYFAFT